MRTAVVAVVVVMALASSAAAETTSRIRATVYDVSRKVHVTQTAQYTFCGGDGHTCTPAERWARQEELAVMMPVLGREFAPFDPSVTAKAIDAIKEYNGKISTAAQYFPGVLSNLRWPVKPNGDDYSHMQGAVEYAHDRAVGSDRDECATQLSADVRALLSVHVVGGVCKDDPDAFAPPEGVFSLSRSRLGVLDAYRMVVPRWTADQLSTIERIIATHAKASADHCVGPHTDADVQGAIIALENDPRLTPAQQTLLAIGRFDGFNDGYDPTDACTFARVTDYYFGLAWRNLRAAGTVTTLAAREEAIIQWFLAAVAHRVVHTMQNLRGTGVAVHLLTLSDGSGSRFGVAPVSDWPYVDAEQLLERYRQ